MMSSSNEHYPQWSAHAQPSTMVSVSAVRDEHDDYHPPVSFFLLLLLSRLQTELIKLIYRLALNPTLQLQRRRAAVQAR